MAVGTYLFKLGTNHGKCFVYVICGTGDGHYTLWARTI